MSDDTKDEPKVHFLENEDGGVVSVDHDHFTKYLTEGTNSGKRYLLHGWKEITEAAAKKANPQLFGAPDPQITFTDDELVRAANRKKLLAELHADK